MATVPSASPYSLESRGLAEAAHRAGWRRNQHGNYDVPLYHPDGTRFLHVAHYNTSENARQRFGKINLPAGASDLAYYTIPGFRQAIQRSGGICYLAAGITDHLSYIAAGIENVIAPLRGELAIPSRFADDLRLWGVTHLIHLPDRDPAGLKSAQRIAARLLESEITYSPRLLPGSGKDINDLWRTLIDLGAAAPLLFRTAIEATSLLEIQPEIVTEKKKQSFQPGKPDSSTTDQLVRELVNTYAGKTRQVESGTKIIHRCIHPQNHKHGDRSKSAATFLNESDSGLPVTHCESCGQFTFVQVCHHLGITVRWDTLPASDSESRQAAATSTAITYIPADVRQAMKASGHIHAARFIDLLFYAGIQPGSLITVNDAEAALLQLVPPPAKPLYRNRAIRNHMTNCSLGALGNLSIFVSMDRDLECRISRPATRYQVPTIADLRRAYRVHSRKSGDPVPFEAMLTEKSYSIAAYREVVATYDEEWQANGAYESAAQLGERLGVSKRTIWRYEQHIPDLHRERRWIDQPCSEARTLTPQEKAQGCSIMKINGERVFRTPIASARRVVNDDLIDFAKLQLGAVITPGSPVQQNMLD